MLDTQLPVRGLDRHLLLFRLASDASFDGVFGDEGGLKVWVRRADLAISDVSSVVSFSKMT